MSINVNRKWRWSWRGGKSPAVPHAGLLYVLGAAGLLTLVPIASIHAEAARHSVTVMNRGSACQTLASVAIPASAIGLPTSGAEVTGAELIATTAKLPQFCKVRGRVNAANPADPPIFFELNLPTAWNGKSLQLGGGGFNGVVVTGLDRAPGGSDRDPVPLSLGYSTFGSDSGHSATGGFDGRFGMNAQALANYNGESIKRTHDVATFLIRRYYGRTPRRTYYAGGSKGGQEALAAAQRYGGDYDGIIAFYPAAENQGLVAAWYNMWKAAYGRPGASLDLAKQELVKKAVLASCDALDGVRDGVIANTKLCSKTFAIKSIRCAAGRDTGDTCLSDPQIDALQFAAKPHRFPFSFANGVVSVGPYPVYEGGDFTGLLYSRTGDQKGEDAVYKLFFDQVWPYFDALDPSFHAENFNLRDFQARALLISAQFDSTNPNLDRFRDRNGKVIIVQGTTDMLVPPSMTTAYVDQLRRRYGAGFRRFVRYYVQPGFGHASGVFMLNWNALGALDYWVEKGRPPAKPVAVDANPANGGRSMPLCEHPLYPRYTGVGSSRDARNYRCARG